MAGGSHQTEFVNVAVPREHVTKVYGYIASLDGSETAVASTSGSESEQENNGWGEDLIRRQFAESPPTIQQFQRHLAANPGQWISMTDIAKALNATYGSKTIAGALGAYGRRTSNRYAMKNWPFNTRWNHTQGQQHYSMTPEVARIIDSI